MTTSNCQLATRRPLYALSRDFLRHNRTGQENALFSWRESARCFLAGNRPLYKRGFLKAQGYLGHLGHLGQRLFDGVEVLKLPFWGKAKSHLREIITSCKGKRNHKVAKVTYRNAPITFTVFTANNITA